MKNKKNILTIVILLLAVGIVIGNFIQSNKEKEAKESVVSSVVHNPKDLKESSAPKEGESAIDFHLSTLSGEDIKLSELRGKKVILNFWATWCPPCKAEMPHMQNFYKKNKDNGIEVVAVNLTKVDNGYDAIQSFVEEYGLTFPIPLDKNGELGNIYQAFTIPTTYFIDTSGKIHKKIIGPMNESMMESFVKEMN